jgi:hypothetical protein
VRCAVNKAVLVVAGLLAWLVLSVPAALWVSRVLKARREEMERTAQREAQARKDRLALLERRDRQGPPSWDRPVRPVPRPKGRRDLKGGKGK